MDKELEELLGKAEKEFKNYNYEKAIGILKKAKKLNNPIILSRLGLYFLILGKYEESVEYLEKARKLDPSNYELINNLHHCYLELGNYEKIIENFEEAKKIKPTDFILLIHLGLYYFKIGNYEKAIENFEEGDKLKPFDGILNELNISYLKLGKFQKALENFKLAHYSELDILQITRDENFTQDFFTENENSLYNKMLEKHNLELTEHSPDYSAIYLQTLALVSSLYVDSQENSPEKKVSHYTSKTVAHKLLFEKCKKINNKEEINDCKYQLGTIAKANDPNEGKTLLDFLNLPCPTSHQAQAFIGCFTFNHDSLNQFRLYGKENNQEATGISLVFNPSFFSEKAGLENINLGNIPAKLSLKEDIKTELAESVTEKLNSLPLYRCVYIDNLTKQIVSVGQREEYTFYREYREEEKPFKVKIQNEIQKEYNIYNKQIDGIIKEVKTKFSDLFKLVNKESKKIKDTEEKEKFYAVVSDLLIYLRYLVKDAAYKEEQECRIFKVLSLRGNEEIQYENGRMFIEYQPIKAHIKKIYFGPKANDLSFYQDLCEKEGLDIKIEQSSHSIL